MKKFIAIIGTLVLFYGLSAASPALSGNHLSEPLLFPADLKVVAPSADVPPDVKALVGVGWEAIWKNKRSIRYGGRECWRRAILVVEEILSPAKARVVYSWGRCPGFEVVNPGWKRYEAELSLRDDGSVILGFVRGGKLAGTGLTFRKPKGQNILFAGDDNWEAEFRPRALQDIK